MKTELKTQLLTRLSFGALALALLAGVFAAGTLVRTSADAQPADNPPEPCVTAYVDFLALLEVDSALLAEQFEITQEVRTQTGKLERKYMSLIREEEENKRLYKPNTISYRRARDQALKLRSDLYREQVLLEQTARKHLRDFGIERFKDLRELTTEIALERGYNEVLNIVRDIEDVAGQGDDFQSLQQQLLISPVLYYDEAHDITDVVLAAAKEKWGTSFSMPNPITFTLEDDEKPLEANEEGEFEIRFGQKGTFKVDVADEGIILPADDKSARVKWSKTGAFAGDLDEGGNYTAPDEWPSGAEDTFTVMARCAEDPSVNKSITVRLLNKDGQTKAEAEEAGEDSEDNEEKESPNDDEADGDEEGNKND